MYKLKEEGMKMKIIYMCSSFVLVMGELHCVVLLCESCGLNMNIYLGWSLWWLV